MFGNGSVSQWNPILKRCVHHVMRSTFSNNERVHRLVNIQAAFGFPMPTLAQVLTVPLSELHRWLDATRSVVLGDAQVARLEQIEALAIQWLARSPVPLSAVAHERLSNGTSVLQMLLVDLIDDEGVAHVFDELVGLLVIRPKSPVAQGSFSRRPSWSISVGDSD